MSSKYTYSIASDFPNTQVNTTKLGEEIGESTITRALDYINTSEDDCDIWFKATLLSGEETVLSGVVAAHDGEFTPEYAPTWMDGRPIIRADTRPLNTKTYFSCAGDTASGIGDGNSIWWDFSNDNDLVIAPSGYKRKRIELYFIDPIYVKEGTNYFFDTMKGSYIDFFVVCPSGQFYYTNAGTPVQAQEDTKIVHYINKHYYAGDCPMGDELNTEGCSDTPVPTNYKIWIEVTVPSGDNISYGWGSMELYRSRTVII